MKKSLCANAAEFDFADRFFECGTCGNHLCRTQAERWKMVCPHCFGTLFKIS